MPAQGLNEDLGSDDEDYFPHSRQTADEGRDIQEETDDFDELSFGNPGTSYANASSASAKSYDNRWRKRRRSSKHSQGLSEVSPLLRPRQSPNHLSPFPYGFTEQDGPIDLSQAWTKDTEFDRRSASVTFEHLSSFSQTLFNTSNVLLGVGILAEPVAFAHAGWIAGTLVLLYCGLITNYTAKILARILRDHPQLCVLSLFMTLRNHSLYLNSDSYADIGAYAFGQRTRVIISILFCLELFAVSVALVVLFGDSASALVPRLTTNEFKIVGFFIITPTIFLPLRLLSYTSLIG